MTDFLVWGGGGHGKVVADLVRAAGHRLAGFVDRDPAKRGQVVEPGGAVVVADEQELLDAIRRSAPLPAGAGALALAVGDNAQRARCLAALGDTPCPPLVHPTATVSPSAAIGRGTVVFPRVVVNAAARIGDAVILNTGAVVEHDCVVGHAAHLSPMSSLCGSVRVGDRGWIGAGATVVPGVRIGDDARVGAGAVAVRDVPVGATVAGVPARPLVRTSNDQPT